MNGNDHLRQTLEYYRQQLQKKMEELVPLQLMIRNLERDLGESPSVPDAPELASSAAFQPLAFGGDRSADIRPDEFYGMSHNEAAKTYLTKIGRAISLDELVSALKKGGAQVGGATPKKSLYVSLMRNPLREFVSPSENHVGLRSFYPGLPKGDRAAKATKAKKGKPRKKTLRPMKNSKRTASGKKADGTGEIKTAQQNQAPAKEVPIALHSLMKDGKSRSKSEIVKELEANLGHPIAKIAVYGTLKSKQYEKQDNGEYKFVSVQ